MKNKPHLHQIGDFNVWYTRSGWMAAPVSSGQCRKAAVMIPSRKGALGSKIRRDSDGVLAVTHPSFICSHDRVVRTNMTRKSTARVEAAIYAAYRQSPNLSLEWKDDGILGVVRWDSTECRWHLVESAHRPQKGGR